MSEERRRWIRGTLVVAFFTALSAIISYPLAFHLGSRIGEHRDAYFSVWRLAWVARQLRHDPLHLFDANIFYPEARTLAFSDAMLLPATVLAPLHWVGIEPVVVYNLTLLVAFVLSGCAAYALVRTLTGSTAAGLLGGVIFAFSPFRMEHFDHLELQFAFWIPMAVLAWHRATTEPTVKRYLLVAALASGQVLSCIYYGVFLLTWLCVMTIAALIQTPREAFKACGLVLAPPLTVLAMYSLPYVAVRQRLGERLVRDVINWSASITDFWSAPASNVLYGSTHALAIPERHLFPGIIAVLLLVAGVWPPWNRVRALHVAGLAVATQLAFGFNGLLYPLLHEWVLPYRGLRVPARAAILVLLATAVFAGYGLARITAHRRRPLAALIAAGAIGLASAEYLSRPELRNVDARVFPWYKTLRDQAGAVVYEWPTPAPSRLHRESPEAFYMYRSTLHWRPLLNGYSGNHTSAYGELLLHMRAFPDTFTLKYLQQAGATVLIVHDVNGTDPSYDYAVDRLVRDPSVRVIAQGYDSGRRISFFRLSPPSEVPAR